MYVVLGKQLKQAKAILAEEDVPIDCSSPCSQKLSVENVLEVVLLAALGVRKCHSCKGGILRTKCPQKIWFFLQAVTANMEGPKNLRIVSMLWQHLFSLDYVMCTEAQQRNDC